MQLRQFPDKNRFFDLAKSANVVPVCAEILADTVTPVTLLKTFYDNGQPLFLLESVEGGERWGRYSFLGISTRYRVRVFSEHISIDGNHQNMRQPHGGNPLALLKSMMARFRPASIPELPNFWGGLVGYFTYEMVSFFENIPNQWPPDKALADFVIPDELLIFDNIRHTLFIVVTAFLEDNGADNTQDETQMGIDYADAIQRINRIIGDIKTKPSTPEPPPPKDCGLLPQISPKRYRDQIHEVKRAIRAGDIIQAVISQPFICETPPDFWQLYRAQRYINPSPYMFFIHFGQTALVGSSPETMIRLENNVATLRPIAGTRPRAGTEQEDRALADDLLSDEKERAEHLMLVDLGRNDLGRVARTGSVQVTDLMIVERYSHVMHLVSNICCDLDDKTDAWDLFRSVFPAGTLSGAPKVRAMEIIAATEKSPRGPYGGAVGYISFHGDMDMAITIRTAHIENGRLTVRAGAGIVSDSDPEAERIESVNKAMAIAKALQLAGGRGPGKGEDR